MLVEPQLASINIGDCAHQCPSDPVFLLCSKPIGNKNRSTNRAVRLIGIAPIQILPGCSSLTLMMRYPFSLPNCFNPIIVNLFCTALGMVLSSYEELYFFHLKVTQISCSFPSSFKGIKILDSACIHRHLGNSAISAARILHVDMIDRVSKAIVY